MNLSKYLLFAIILILIFEGFFFYHFFKRNYPISTTQTTLVHQSTAKQNNISTKDNKVQWVNYSNSQLGFSIKYPSEIPTIYRCPNKQVSNTPLTFFEDNENGNVYIVPEYYYDANWSQANQKYIGDCSKITYSLDSLKKEEGLSEYQSGIASHPFLGWKIIIDNLDSDKELSNIVKQNFGSTCTIQTKVLQEDGNYSITFKGRSLVQDGQGIMDETCYNNFVYKIMYSPEKKKLMSVILGQECTFGTDPNDTANYKCFDNEMIKSFKFQ